MPEGLSGSEIGKEIAEHAKHAATDKDNQHPRARWVTISEAVLLSVVAILAAYSGYSAAKWNTDSSVSLASATASRSKANRADLESLAQRNFDSSTFNTWFSAYVAGDKRGMALAERRFSPAFRVAFDAWWATDPTTNPNAAPGPTYMSVYREPQLIAAHAYDAKANALFAAGAEAGATSDKYVRITVYLATVLFLIGISGHFPVLAARYGLVALGGVLVVFSVTQLLQLPRPPG